jgi:predicted 3-demethylubiquinone-9 3-methyltransferase (glyoxalase superfamily)
MSKQIKTFLMFQGQAEEALDLYRSLFRDAVLLSMEKYGSGESGAEGSVKLANFSLNAQEFMCIDSPVDHGFSFSPSMSLYVDCESEEEIDRVFAALSDGGSVLMPLDRYPFSEKFGWVADRFGVSWQLNLS